MWKNIILALGLVIGLGGCAQTPATGETGSETNSHPNDPLEGFNRAMWALNYDYLDPYVARPVSIAYVDYVPSWTRTGISNFLGNLEEPASMVNSLVMLEGERAANHFSRFFINTVFGLGGVIDLASGFDIQKHQDRQFGDVMGSYGVGQGPYVMIPVYGPITVREAVGDSVDDLYPPLSLLTLPQSFLKWMFDGMESRAALVPRENVLENSPDPYAFARDAYLQNKEFRARGGRAEEEPEPDDEFLEDFMDEIDE